MRLQRAMARAGVASRRKAEELIRSGQVRINGVVATLGQSVDPTRDAVTVRGQPLTKVDRYWIALNKPTGYVVTRRDPQGRPTVFELVPDILGLTYVGRLDVMTTGLLLMTNQGDGVFRLTHPRYRVPRTYRVWVSGPAAGALRRQLADPPPIDGRPVAVTDVAVSKLDNERSVVTLTLTEGRYRIVRRLCTELGATVDRLVRLSHGPVHLGKLEAGTWRHLTPKEMAAIERLIAA